AGKNDTRFPFRFEFRPDLTISVRQQSDIGEYNFGGRIEVFVDRGNDLEIRSIPGLGMYVYQFRLRRDGTLMLTNGGAELVFMREKDLPVAEPDDTPPR